MIQLNINKTWFQNEEMTKKLVKEIYERKVLESDDYKRIDTDFKFYEGKLPEIQISEKKKKDGFEPQVVNLAKPITDTATKTFIGVLPDLVSSGTKKEKDKINVLYQKLYKRAFNAKIFQTGKNSSICGSGLLCVYNKIGDKFPRFRELNPRMADVVYDCTLEQNRICAFNIIEFDNIDNNTKGYDVYIYTDEEIIVYEITQDSTKKLQFNPLLVFVTQGQNVHRIRHGYSTIPIFEFPNNAEFKGDSECVQGLIRLYNNLLNNRCINVHDIVNYILWLKNVRIGDEEEQQAIIDMLENHGLLPTEGEDTEVKYLSNPLNQDELQTLQKSIEDLIHQISRVPDLTSVDFTQNASDPIIKIKTKPLLDLCNEKELVFTEPYFELLECVLKWCEKNDKEDYEKYNADLDLCTLAYAHPLPSNDLDIVTQISNLSNAGVLSPEDALQEISWIKNVHKYVENAKKWKASVDKEKSQNDNINSGVNAHNIEKQNEKPIETGQLDNKRNGAQMSANRISDNNVE